MTVNETIQHYTREVSKVHKIGHINFNRIRGRHYHARITLMYWLYRKKQISAGFIAEYFDIKPDKVYRSINSALLHVKLDTENFN